MIIALKTKGDKKLMGENLTPKTDFGFDVIEKGDHRVKVKETGIDLQAEGKQTGKTFWARLIVIGGSQDGAQHTERFSEKKNDGTTNTFGLSKLAGFLLKIGVIKNPNGIDSDLFKTREFEEKWLKGVPGRELGINTGYRYDKNDKNKETPYSDVKKYYSLDEYLALVNKDPSPVPGGSGSTASVPPTPSPFD